MITSWWYTAPWCVMVGIWILGALGTKITALSEPAARRSGHMFMVVIAAWLFFATWHVPDILRTRIVPDTLAVFQLGVALTWLGLAFAVWARVILGRNWSGMVEVKQDHKLVIAGPYRIVRHPIYSGVLLALLGTALGIGELRSFIALPLFFIAWWTKSRHEEEFMRQQFGEDYARYQSRSKAIIPGFL